MVSISDEYLILFGAVSDALKALNTLQANLVLAQQVAEEAFISADESSRCSANASH